MILEQKAVSNQTRTTRLYLDPRRNRGDNRLYDSADGRRSVPVEAVTLDDFFAGRDEPVHLIKMDIQGAEMAALQGMTKTIKKNTNLTLLTEFWPAGLRMSGSSPETFLDALIQAGFALHTRRDGEPVPTNPESVMEECANEVYLVCTK